MHGGDSKNMREYNNTHPELSDSYGGAVSHALKSAVENRLVLAINGTIPKSRRGLKGGKVSYQEGLKNFRDTTKAVGQVFLPLNRGALGRAKRQIIQAGADRASDEINPLSFESVFENNSAGPTSGEQRRMNRSSRGRPPMPPPMMPMDMMPMEMPMMPMPKLQYSRNIPMAYAVEEEDLSDLPMPPTHSPYSATYAIPKGKLYASGARKKRVKRVMSQAQKDALAKGRHALRIKLNEMGAGARKKKMHKSGALRPGGY
jgi:hypothetical protein